MTLLRFRYESVIELEAILHLRMRVFSSVGLASELMVLALLRLLRLEHRLRVSTLILVWGESLSVAVSIDLAWECECGCERCIVGSS